MELEAEYAPHADGISEQYHEDEHYQEDEHYHEEQYQENEVYEESEMYHETENYAENHVEYHDDEQVDYGRGDEGNGEEAVEAEEEQEEVVIRPEDVEKLLQLFLDYCW